jgi:tripartite-type tricarboxylate transporter receptor subunit TctC
VLYKKVPYDPVRDFAPISQVAAMVMVVVAHPSLPARTIRELIALAKAHPGQLVYGSSGIGTGPHLAMELFLSMTGVKMEHVPYKGTNPGMMDTMAGQVQVLMSTLLPPLPHIRTGRLRPLGVTGAKRVVSMPDVPTIAEAGVPGYEVIQWYGFVAPANTPREVITKLHGEIVSILKSPEVREKLAADGAEPVGSTPQQFAAFIQSEIDKWGKVVKSAGIRVE